MERKIKAVMIIEVAGRPPEFLTNSMKLHVEKISKVKDVRLVSSRISEVKKLESEKELYTCFAEVEVETNSLTKIMDLVFDFMPSSIEIVEPVDLELNCQEATMFLNDLAGRLHKYDELAKIAKLQIEQMAKKFAQMNQPKITSLVDPVKINIAKKEKPSKKTKKKIKK